MTIREAVVPVLALLMTTVCGLAAGEVVQIVAWDGEREAKGAGWTNVTGGGFVTVQPQTEVAHSGNTALEMRAKGQKWLGAGWNWVGFAKREGTDVRTMKNFVFWVKRSGQAGDLLINLLCGGEVFDTPEHHTAKVRLINYCPELHDGAWHRVVIPLADLQTVPGFDFTKVCEVQMGMMAKAPVDCSFYFDDIGFEAGGE
jgi:hypothetical protein